MKIGVNTPANDRQEMWREWAVKAQKGDNASYSLLLKDLMPFIRAVLIPSLANADWADDIVQEVLISVHKSLHTYSPDRPFKPWLNAIIYFRRTDFLRRHYSARDNKQATMDNVDFQRSHVTNPAHVGELKDVEFALSQLPDKQRKVFSLMKIEGYSAKEVAEKMNMSVSAVKVSAYRATHKLKDILDR